MIALSRSRLFSPSADPELESTRFPGSSPTLTLTKMLLSRLGGRAADYHLDGESEQLRVVRSDEKFVRGGASSTDKTGASRHEWDESSVGHAMIGRHSVEGISSASAIVTKHESPLFAVEES